MYHTCINLLPGLQTTDGIDQCGMRLAEEIKGVVARNPSLEYISVLGHSMGGLIARYAIGETLRLSQLTLGVHCII